MGIEFIGQTLNRYLITNPIEETGVDLVYKGVDGKSKREVLIRIMPELFTRLPGFEEQFLLTARAASRLDHPGIARIIDYGKDKSYLYLVTELISGTTLAQKIDDTKIKHEYLQQLEIIQIGRQIAQALDYASKQGVEHIDIQPSRILLKPGANETQPLIIDLGLAWFTKGESMLPESKLVTIPSFLSPEQARGAPQDIRSDVYKVGVLLYQLATVKLPFPVKTLEEAVEYHRKEQPPPPHLLRQTLWENFEQVILTALQKDPNKRFPDMASLAQALEKAATRLQVTPSKPPLPDLVKKPVTQPGIDCLLVETPNRPAYTLAIKPGEMSIGRGNEADIPLNSLAVSRTHAKLISDGRDYFLIDLESTNGTYLDDGKLLAGVREPWTPSKVARIGPFTLKLMRGSKSASLAVDERNNSQIFRRDGSLAEQKHVHVSSGEGRIGVVLEEDDLKVAPGGSIGMTILLRNQGNTVDHFKASIEGVPPSWVNIQPQTVNLMPDNQGSIEATFTPPKSSTSKAGTYDLTIYIFSSEAPDQKVDVIAGLTVLPFTEYDSELHPQKIDTNQKARVTIRNQSNHSETFILALKDSADKLAFTPAQAKVEIAEGQRGAIDFTARTRQWQFFRKSVSYAYTAELISASGGGKRSHPGEITNNGLIPKWLPVLLVFICLGLAGATGVGACFLLKICPSTAISSTPSPIIAQSPTTDLTVTPPFVVQQNTETPIPSTVASPAISPTPTKTCGIFTQGFKKGDKVEVMADIGLNVYAEANDSYPIDKILFHTILVVIDDTPICVTIKATGASVLRWNIRLDDTSKSFYNGSSEGWVTEAEGKEFLIKPKK
jgi:serine/threonine protein kinase